MKRHPSTICRKHSRNRGQRGYRPKQAQHLCEGRVELCRNALRIEPADWAAAQRRLREQHSPEQVAAQLPVSHEKLSISASMPTSPKAATYGATCAARSSAGNVAPVASSAVAASRAPCHAAQQRNPALRCARAQRDDALMQQIQRVWQVNMQVYGADKLWRQLKREGIQVARCTVERLMKRLGLEGARRGKIVQTTVPDKALPCPLDRVNRQFKADRPNQLWVSDFTYVSTWQGWLYAEKSNSDVLI